MKEWNSKSRNLNKCEELLNKAKIMLAGVSFLPTSCDAVSSEEVLLARDVLEVGVQCSVERGDIPAFERYMAQLKCYYTDYQTTELPPSSYQLQLLGLNLMSLLASNKVGEFHTELELLPVDALHSSAYIKYPVSLEQYLMEGNYNKIRLSRGSVPAPQYTFFVERLLDSITRETALCMEKAYERMSAAETMRMLELKDAKQLASLAQQRGWRLDDSGFVNFTNVASKTSLHAENGLASLEMAQQTIEYARQLEMIV